MAVPAVAPSNMTPRRDVRSPPTYTPQVGVGFRINAFNGSCYYQSAQPNRDKYGNPDGTFQPWAPAAPGVYYGASYTG